VRAEDRVDPLPYGRRQLVVRDRADDAVARVVPRERVGRQQQETRQRGKQRDAAHQEQLRDGWEEKGGTIVVVIAAAAAAVCV
jgi:hypothetical protein